MNEEGWYTDPYGMHEARWMSEGQPTALVRDGDVESTDEAPDGPPTSSPQRISAEGEDGLAASDFIPVNESPDEPPPDYRDAGEAGFGSAR